MNNLFKIYNHENEEIKTYFIREISPEKKEQLDNMYDQFHNTDKKINGPFILIILIYLFGGLGAIFFIASINIFLETSKFKSNDLIIHFTAITFIVLAALLFIFLRARRKKVENSPEVISFIDSCNKMVDESFLALNVPSNALTMDILFVPTKKQKNGKEKHMKTLYSYINKPLKVFIEGDNLCFADCYSVLALKLDSFKYIKKKKKHISLTWNKEKPYNDPEYKEYKIKYESYGLINIKYYYSVKHELNGEEFELLIPNYEIKQFISLIPLEIIDDK